MAAYNTKKIELELCADNHRAVLLAEKYGIKRIELCSALSVGGLTPSTGLVKECSGSTKVEIHTMIRHREGNFRYEKSDIRIMEKDIKALKKAGAKGVVFGCLTKYDEVDISACTRLITLCKELDLKTTFHRAIDFCPDSLAAMEELAGLGFTRILTSGKQKTAIEGIELITKMTAAANGRIQVMAGSGVNGSNAKRLADSGVDALHFTSHTSAGFPQLGMGEDRIMDEEKIRKICMESGIKNKDK